MISFDVSAIVVLGYKLPHTVTAILQQHFFPVPEHSAIADTKSVSNLGDGQTV